MSGTIIITAAAGDATGSLGLVAGAFPEDTVGDQRKSGNQADDAADNNCYWGQGPYEADRYSQNSEYPAADHTAQGDSDKLKQTKVFVS